LKGASKMSRAYPFVASHAQNQSQCHIPSFPFLFHSYGIRSSFVLKSLMPLSPWPCIKLKHVPATPNAYRRCRLRTMPTLLQAAKSLCQPRMTSSPLPDRTRYPVMYFWWICIWFMLSKDVKAKVILFSKWRYIGILQCGTWRWGPLHQGNKGSVSGSRGRVYHLDHMCYGRRRRFLFFGCYLQSHECAYYGSLRFISGYTGSAINSSTCGLAQSQPTHPWRLVLICLAKLVCSGVRDGVRNQT
jgi:hypothetical protein